MRLQKLVVVMSMLAGGIASVNSHALGLGEVKLYSALNQPLVAEIELMQVKELTRSEILSNLASKQDFERAGIQRPYNLSNLRFTTEVGADGRGVIKVTSQGPIHEPYINFLVEVHWPSGRLLKEYTLLLDPPAFNGRSSVTVNKATSVPQHYGSRPVWDEPPTTQSNYLPSPQPLEHRDYNQPAKPSARQRETFSNAPANDTYKVKRNDNLWSIAEKARPDSGVTVQQTMLAIQRGNPQAFIDNNINRIKAGQVLRLPDREEINSLTVREAIADVSRQNREWQQARSQVAQIDATRQGLPIARNSAETPEGKLAIVSADTLSGEGQDLGGSAATKEESAALQTELAMTREQLDKLSRENAELTSRLKDLDEQIVTLKRLITMKDDQMAALQSQSNEVQPAPVSPRQPEPMPVVDNGLFGSSFFMILLALFPLAGVGWYLYQRWKKQQEAASEEDDGIDLSSLRLDAEEDSLSSPKPVAKPSDEDVLKFDDALAIDDSVINEVEAEEDEETTQQTEDPLSEADIYIAYGRLDQAEELLKQSIYNEPDRSDLKLKLVEVYSEGEDLNKFQQALQDLEATGDTAAIAAANPFKARFPDAYGDESSAVQEDEMPDLDLDSLDDLDLGDDDGDDLDELDFDLGELDNSESEADELDFGLDDLDLPVTDSVAKDTQAAFSDEGGSSLEAALDDDLDFLSESDEVATKLDLARAYIDMGDMEGASGILQEVVEQGNDEQKQEAMEMLKSNR